MDQILPVFVLVPLAGFLISLLLPRQHEKKIAALAVGTTLLNLVLFSIFVVYWLSQGHPVLHREELYLYRSGEYNFVLELYFDRIALVYLLVGLLLAFLITAYSQYYMHRDPGFKRFFTTILFFYAGYNITVLSGNFESLFIGWEFIGISSFLLVAFYRDRYLPVRNAVKVFAVYRIGDVGILLAMWGSHHFWQRNISFAALDPVHDAAGYGRPGLMIFIALMLLLAACVKSAQFPFSYWLPKAMEGPTTSSAVFYGSLSVHFGVFILLRSFPFWQDLLFIRVLVAVLGLVTAILAYFTAQVQSTAKSRVAYASVSQIGLIFLEVSAGFTNLALLHFAGNAFLRTYQLLISPSALSYLIREQFYRYTPRRETPESAFRRRVGSTLYVLALREWNMERLLNKLVFSPLKKTGRRLRFVNGRNVFFFFVPAYLAGLALLYAGDVLPGWLRQHIPEFFSLLGILMVLRSFSERRNPFLAWLLVLMNHFWVALAVSFNEYFDRSQVFIYLSGIVSGGILGGICLYLLYRSEKKYFDLNRYYGHVYEHRRLSLVFLLAVLGLVGFPLTPTFVGEDLIFSHIHETQPVLAFFNALGFIFGGISLIRMYARLFLGPHVKTYHETSYRSS
ncbi:MAG: proton-conducting transporter transmembrane domain-containing protein [Flavobacteriales bacterium]